MFKYANVFWKTFLKKYFSNLLLMAFNVVYLVFLRKVLMRHTYTLPYKITTLLKISNAHGEEGIMNERQNEIKYGEYCLYLQTSPASLQSSSKVKDEYKNKIRDVIKNSNNIFGREIGISIEWVTSPKSRYETDKAYDIDNIIKPTLDAMTGKNGLFIDDCQVQNVMCYWIDKNSEDSPDELYIKVFALEKNNDYVFDKNNIVFFQLEGPIYYLVPTKHKAIAEYIFNTCNNIHKKYSPSMDIYHLSWPMGAVKYHITRINKSRFQCIKLEDINKYIANLDD